MKNIIRALVATNKSHEYTNLIFSVSVLECLYAYL